MNLQTMLKQINQDKVTSLHTETRAKIKAKLKEAERLENMCGLSVLEAQASVKQAQTLRAEAQALEGWMHGAEFEILANARRDHDDLAALHEISQLQSGLIEEHANHQQEIDNHFENSVNLLMGADKRDLKRQIQRIILSNEAETDEQGRKYVRFQLPESGATNRCIQLASGKFGFVVCSKCRRKGKLYSQTKQCNICDRLRNKYSKR